MDQSFDALLNTGALQTALDSVVQRIKKHPDDPQARAALVTLSSYCGALDWAYDQLKEWARLAPDHLPLLLGYEAVLGGEKGRQAVLNGQEAPVLKGPADELSRRQADVLGLWCAGCYDEAARLAQHRPGAAVRGTVDGRPFHGLEDYDSRFGVLLEAILPEGYRLVPWSTIRSIRMQPPHVHLDAIWRPALLELADGPVTAYLPARYPGTERVTDPLVRMGRKTVCHESPADFFTAVGQRFWLTHEPSADIQILGFGEMQLEPSLASTREAA